MGVHRIKKEDEEWLKKFGDKPSLALRKVRDEFDGKSTGQTANVEPLIKQLNDLLKRIEKLEKFLAQNSGGQFT